LKDDDPEGASQMTAIRTRLVISLAILMLAIAATAVYVASSSDGPGGPRTFNAELLNKNDGKDNCPNDGNAGGGNDGNCAPSGSYGNVNPNDGKDNCPTDGNAGKGNDTKGPNGGCRS
jgi:hypothetical protein